MLGPDEGADGQQEESQRRRLGDHGDLLADLELAHRRCQVHAPPVVVLPDRHPDVVQAVTGQEPEARVGEHRVDRLLRAVLAGLRPRAGVVPLAARRPVVVVAPVRQARDGDEVRAHGGVDIHQELEEHLRQVELAAVGPEVDRELVVPGRLGSARADRVAEPGRDVVDAAAIGCDGGERPAVLGPQGQLDAVVDPAAVVAVDVARAHVDTGRIGDVAGRVDQSSCRIGLRTGHAHRERGDAGPESRCFHLSPLPGSCAMRTSHSQKFFFA